MIQWMNCGVALEKVRFGQPASWGIWRCLILFFSSPEIRIQMQLLRLAIRLQFDCPDHTPLTCPPTWQQLVKLICLLNQFQWTLGKVPTAASGSTYKTATTSVARSAPPAARPCTRCQWPMSWASFMSIQSHWKLNKVGTSFVQNTFEHSTTTSPQVRISSSVSPTTESYKPRAYVNFLAADK